MIASELLDILVCPETKQELRLLVGDELASLNERIANRALTNRGGTTVVEQIEGLLVRSDGQFGYPVRDGIPVMLVEEGIPISE